MRSLKHNWQTNWEVKLSKYASVLAVIIVFGGLGTSLLLTSHAATPAASVQAENGTVSAAAGGVTDATASAGQAVKFGSGSSSAVCPPYPAFPDASCTGWQHTGVTLTTVTPTSSGNGWHVEVVGGTPVFYVTQANAVVDSLDIPYQVKIFADNVTIQRSRITQEGFYTIIVGDLPSTNQALHLTDVELDGQGGSNNQTIAVLGNVNAVYTRINVHGMGSSGPRLTQGNIMQDSYLHDFSCTEPDHTAGVSANDGGSGIQVLHNNIDIDQRPGCATAAFELAKDFGSYNGVTISQNMFNGGSYCAYFAATPDPANPNPPSVNLTVTNNVFGRKYAAECGTNGPVAQWAAPAGSNNVWSGNTWGGGALATSSHAVGDPVVP
jgi:hypothetical protein